jgi:hypothetical protein
VGTHQDTPTVMTTFPIFRPVSTYLCASGICAN